MSNQDLGRLESVLEGVSPSRRSFLRGLLLAGAGGTFLVLPASSLIADDATGDGKGKGDGEGDGKGKGKGKCKGEGDAKGKGKCKGKGKGDGEALPHEEILTEIRAIRKLVGAPKRDVPADAADEPPHQQILRELHDLRKFLETRPANQK